MTSPARNRAATRPIAARDESQAADAPPPAPDVDCVGMTLAEFAAARGSHPQAVRAEYAARMRGGIGLPLPVTQVDRRDGVTKFCLAVGSGSGTLESESVIIPMNSYRGTDWHTLCVSSQVGCRMGCTFCETARMGWLRNLSAGDIVAQRLAARQLMPGRGAAQGRFRYFADGIQNIVFMGMGEPFDTFEPVIQAIRVLNEPCGLDFPLTQITISTVGRVDGLRQLAALARAPDRDRDWRNLRLAISLTAADDRLRDVLMPINRGMPLAELQRALLEYPLSRKGRYLIQYVLIRDVNDSLADADAVAAWCRPLPCVVNVIPYNPQRDAAYATPSEDIVLRFMLRLRDQGIFVKRRITRGRDLMGACGQLGNPALRRRPHNQPAA
ncbi:MAG TPA: 23S rRNA (adenine(2503)-C(2))-methyltransferase RlmN [Candidatus Acidoferrales bacterium]|nr:23S rRNA (adenine(2503)-C(2))-methyltransferase RlmN [Candidatus Acidoferrales bacterium]